MSIEVGYRIEYTTPQMELVPITFCISWQKIIVKFTTFVLVLVRINPSKYSHYYSTLTDSRFANVDSYFLTACNSLHNQPLKAKANKIKLRVLCTVQTRYPKVTANHTLVEVLWSLSYSMSF